MGKLPTPKDAATSARLRRQRTTGTSPEEAMAVALRKCGFRVDQNVAELPGRPDLVLPKSKIVIFVHGCFWHRHKGCQFCYMPKSRVEFWLAKFESNVQRDRKVKKLLKKLGWQVLTVWECELRYPDRLSKRLDKALHTPSKIT